MHSGTQAVPSLGRRRAVEWVMTIHYPVVTPPRSASAAVAPAPGGTAASTWRYDGGRRSRAWLAAAAALSAGLHGALFYGVSRPEARVAAAPKDEFVIRLTPMPEIKDLEEPEPAASSEAPRENVALVPMQQDLPQLPQPSDFVQKVNFESLLERPDFSDLKLAVIPPGIRAATQLAEKIGRIFNLEDLDRTPVPVLQPAPVYPHSMRREGIEATVTVEFVVDTDGRVLGATIVESTNRAFDEAAIAGVGRWKFRAGVRAGKKVNTRMRVPIVFKTFDVEI